MEENEYPKFISLSNFVLEELEEGSLKYATVWYTHCEYNDETEYVRKDLVPEWIDFNGINIPYNIPLLILVRKNGKERYIVGRYLRREYVGGVHYLEIESGGIKKIYDTKEIVAWQIIQEYEP